MAKVRANIQKAIQRTEKEIRKDYNSITATWNHSVDIDSETEIAGAHGTVLVGTDDKVFNYLDKGTRVRYALMAPGYQRKTRPGRIASSGGGGRVRYIGKARPAFYSRRKRWPLPGIKARGYTRILQRRHSKRFRELIIRTVVNSV